MIQLPSSFIPNTHYINYGWVFSRLLLLQQELKKQSAYILIVENDKTLDSYLKIAKFLNIEIQKVEYISDFVNAQYNNTGRYITTQEIFSIDVQNKQQFEYKNILHIQQGKDIQISQLTESLGKLWYTFSQHKSNNSYKIHGDTLSIIFSWGEELQISFWWHTIDTILYETTSCKQYFIWSVENIVYTSKMTKEFEFFQENFVILDSLDFYSSYDQVVKNLSNTIILRALTPTEDYVDIWLTDLFIKNIDELRILLDSKGRKKYIFTKNKKTLQNFLELNNMSWIQVFESSLNNLKSFQNKDIVVICDDNISRIFVKKRIKRNLSKDLDLLMQIKPWDYIVHIDHGVWIFREIIEKEFAGIKNEYITIDYKNNDTLFIPITEVARVSKYVGSENPKLTGLWTKEWERKLKKAWEDVEIIAGELLEVFAKRKLNKWFAFKSFPDQEERFAHSFDYTYTPDQLHVIQDIYTDMESIHPMDRLLSWDVGFWKTEIAFAAMYKAVINGKQAALISPLVVLAYEHWQKAIERFKDFPINIWVVTRFEKPSAIAATLERLKTGKIDIIIWTHRLLSEDIVFKNLWLLVVDEEHKFWVKDKEKIKKFKWDIDILSMSATPIPRSLNMALNGIKSVSMLTTPPLGRQDIQTIVSAFDDRLIFEAWKREFERKWQLFFIHNRVETIDAMAKYLVNIFPGKKIVVAHGQLSWDQLEQRIIEFKRKQHDILLATTVIENGIDFSNVNTIFINEAQNFGISQIHQLRWRVGRSDRKGYCYLLFKKDKIKEDAAKRLKTIVDYSHLWAWFELAVKDLEVRWWWDILGVRQSGQSQEIGVNLFLEMLENKVEELKNTFENNTHFTHKKIQTTVDLNISAYIDDNYFASELDKINFYREIESLEDTQDLQNIVSDFKELNHDLPKATHNLFDLLELKLKANKYMISSIKKVWINYQIDFDSEMSMEDLKKFLDKDKQVKLSVINLKRLRTATKNFENEEKFIQYMLQLFDNKLLKRKVIKLKKK